MSEISYMDTQDLLIDSEFKELIAPLSDSEFKQLSGNCVADGIRDPIIVWNNTIIDGHNRFRIAQEHALSFNVKEMSFQSRDDAKRWIIENQLGRRNISKYERCRLALFLKDSVAAAANQRMLAGKTTPPQKSAEGTTGETRDTLAKLAGVSHDTLSKVETLEREADDDVKAKLRSGELSINKAWTQLKKRQKKADVLSSVSSDLANEQVSEQFGSITNTSVTSPSFLFPDRRQRVPFLDDVPDKSDELTGTATVNLFACSDIEESLSVISEQKSFISDFSLPDDLESLLLERWHLLVSLFKNKPVYSTSDDLDKEWSGDFILSPLPGLESDFKTKLEESSSLGNVGYVLAVEPFIVDSLRSFLEVAEFSFTYEDHGTLYQVLVLKGSDIE